MALLGREEKTGVRSDPCSLRRFAETLQRDTTLSEASDKKRMYVLNPSHGRRLLGSDNAPPRPGPQAGVPVPSPGC